MKKLLSLLMVFAIMLSLAVTVCAEETILPFTGIKVTATTEYVTNKIGEALDNNINNYWHSDYQHDGKEFTWIAENPHALYIEFDKPTKVSGFRYAPRQDKAYAMGIWDEFNVFATKDGENWEQIYYGTFEWGENYVDRSERRVSWGDYEMVAMQVEITKSADKYCTASIFNLLTGGAGRKITNGAKMEVEVPEKVDENPTNGKIIDREGWKYSATNSDPTNGFGNALDKSLNTYWHSRYEVENGQPVPDPMPYTVTIELPEEMNVSGFMYRGRQDMDLGHWQAVKVYGSLDGSNFDLVYDGPVEYVPGKPLPRTVSWGDVKMSVMKIEILKGVQGFAVASDFDLLTGGKPSERKLDTSGWKIQVDSVNMEKSQASWAGIGAILDGNPASIWHSYYYAEGSVAKGLDTGPFYINITLPEKDVIAGFEYTPRQDDWQGRLLEYNLRVSESDDGELKTIYTGYHSQSDSAKSIVSFGDIGVEVKRIQIETVRTANDIGSISDFTFKAGQKNTRVVPIDDFKEELYKTFFDRIPPMNFEAKASIKNHQIFKIENLFDGGTDYWQAQYTTNPVTLEIDFHDKHIFQRIKLTPKQSSKLDGYWNKFDVLISKDGIKYETILKDYSFDERSKDPKIIELPNPVETRYVGFIIKDFEGGRAAMAEIDFLQTQEMKESETGLLETYKLVIGSNTMEINREGNIKTKQFDAAPYITSVGSTLIPLRGLLEEIGAEIEWNGANKSISIALKDKRIDMQVGDPLVYVNKDGKKIRYTMTAPPRVKNGRTYIPVRFITEHLGYQVTWDAATQSITIG